MIYIYLFIFYLFFIFFYYIQWYKEWSRKRKREKENDSFPSREFEKISLAEVSWMKQNGGNFRVHIEGSLAKYNTLWIQPMVQHRNDNTHPPFGLIKGIAWHEMQLFLHATTHTSYPSIRFTAMAEYTAHVSVREAPYVA